MTFLTETKSTFEHEGVKRQLRGSHADEGSITPYFRNLGKQGAQKLRGSHVDEGSVTACFRNLGKQGAQKLRGSHADEGSITACFTDLDVMFRAST